jgi:hypothetical protein
MNCGQIGDIRLAHYRLYEEGHQWSWITKFAAQLDNVRCQQLQCRTINTG